MSRLNKPQCVKITVAYNFRQVSNTHLFLMYLNKYLKRNEASIYKGPMSPDNEHILI